MQRTKEDILAHMKMGETFHQECKMAQGGLPSNIKESFVAQGEMADKLKVSLGNAIHLIAAMKNELRRIDPKKGDHWEVIKL